MERPLITPCFSPTGAEEGRALQWSDGSVPFARIVGSSHGVRNEITNQAYSIVGRGQRRPCTEKGSLRSGSWELRLVATDAEVTKCPPEPLHVIYAARCTTRGHRLMAEL